MRLLLIVLFGAIAVVMIAVATLAAFEQSIVEAGAELKSSRWFLATLCDAYLGFLIFYVWVAYKEQSLWGRLVWFVLIMCLGNIATASYVLVQLVKLPRGASFSSLLLNPARDAQPIAGR